VSTWPLLRVSLPKDQPVRYFAFEFSSCSRSRQESCVTEGISLKAYYLTEKEEHCLDRKNRIVIDDEGQ